MGRSISRAAAIKSACVMLFVAGTAAELLSLRQQRLIAARDMLRLHELASERRDAAQRIRAEIARRLDPAAIEPLARRAFVLAPLASPAQTPPDAPRASERRLASAHAPHAERRE